MVTVEGLSGVIDTVYSVGNSSILVASDDNNGSYSALGGYNGEFSSLGPFDSNLKSFSSFQFNGTQYWALLFNGSDVPKVYNPDEKTYLDGTTALNFNLTNAVAAGGDQDDVVYGFGNVIKFDNSASDLYVIDNSTSTSSSSASSSSGSSNSTSKLVNISYGNANANVKKSTQLQLHEAAVSELTGGQNVMNSGLFLNDTTVVIGGTFGLNGTDNTNVAFINNGSIVPLSSDITFESGSSVNALFNNSDALVVAFTGSASHGNDELQDLFVYHMNNGSVESLPEKFKSGEIEALEHDPELNDLFIGGNFTSDTCSVLCLYNFNNKSMRSYGPAKLTGDVNFIQYFAKCVEWGSWCR
ncbi:unnamed protein product [Ambrosiozyma monospora]|uniref:Unnamed protein product n=1 Tax=Ambrosiozyma monospora TaxID=43982 RepID=A0A9W6Z8U4_AMBMO|nr:unnamed protein product [Ambrosiozyma monospora]